MAFQSLADTPFDLKPPKDAWASFEWGQERESGSRFAQTKPGEDPYGWAERFRDTDASTPAADVTQGTSAPPQARNAATQSAIEASFGTSDSVMASGVGGLYDNSSRLAALGNAANQSAQDILDAKMRAKYAKASTPSSFSTYLGAGASALGAGLSGFDTGSAFRQRHLMPKPAAG